MLKQVNCTKTKIVKQPVVFFDRTNMFDNNKIKIAKPNKSGNSITLFLKSVVGKPSLGAEDNQWGCKL